MRREHLHAMLAGQPAQHLRLYTVAAQQDYGARAVFDAVLRVTQTDRSAAASYHHVLQRGPVERSRGQESRCSRRVRTKRCGADVPSRVDTHSHGTGVRRAARR